MNQGFLLDMNHVAFIMASIILAVVVISIKASFSDDVDSP